MYLSIMTENIFGDTSDAILKAVAKYRNHPSVTAFKKVSSSDGIVHRGNSKGIRKVDHAKAYEESDVPTNIKGNTEILQKLFK